MSIVGGSASKKAAAAICKSHIVSMPAAELKLRPSLEEQLWQLHVNCVKMSFVMVFETIKSGGGANLT